MRHAAVYATVWPYQLILTDLTVPAMTDAEAMRCIRDMPGPNQNTCICAVSGDPTPPAEAEARAVGFDAHFQKPVSLRELTDLFRWNDSEIPRFLLPEDEC